MEQEERTEKENIRKKIKEKERRTEKTELKVIFWNVAGVRNKDPDFWEYLAKYDIVYLAETWLEEKDRESLEKILPKEFKWDIQIAERENNKGRAKGGMLFGKKKDIEGIEIKQVEKEGIIYRKIRWAEEPWTIIGVYSRGGSSEILDRLKNQIEETNEGNLIILGDFNARTGKEGARRWIEAEEDEEEKEIPKRKTKDEVINKEGKELITLLDERGWAILNGNKFGDEEGEHTFIGKGEGTVIDYGITNLNTWHKIRKFSIEHRGESDHQPLIAEIEGRAKGRKTTMDKKWKEVQIWTEETIKRYHKNLEKVTYIKEEVDEIANELIDKMHEATTKKKIQINQEYWQRNKWWDNECRSKKREMRKKLRRWKKDKGTEEEYRTTRKNFRELCERKKTQQAEKEYREIMTIKTEAEIWKYINKEKKRKPGINNDIEMKEWERHFKELLEGEFGEEESEKEVEKITKSDRAITERELEEAINRLKKKKAPGEDGICNEQIIHANGKTKRRILELLNKVWKGEGWPKRWNKGIIQPIFKKGKTEQTQNYRGITLLNGMYKLYVYILEKKIRTEAETRGMLTDEQAGFRKGRGCRDHIYTLQCAIQKQKNKEKGKLYAFFVDFKAAFDSVDRKKMWEQLRKKGISEELIQRTEEIYIKPKSVVRVNGEESREFHTTKGLRQGCPLSPLLFILYIADLEKYFKERQEGGIVIGNRKVHTLAYADDVVLLATTKKEMEEMIKQMDKYAKRKKLEVNIEKSKVMVIGGGRTEKEEKSWKWSEERRIETVQNFKYLGYVFNKKGGEETNIKEEVRKANIAMKEVWRIGEKLFKDNFRRRMAMFDIMVKSIVMFGVEIWGYKERSDIEKLQVKYIKWILGLDKCTPDYIVLEETKRDKIRTLAGKRVLDFERTMKRETNNMLLRECRREMDKKNKRETKWKKDREEFLEKKGWSRWEMEAKEERGEDIITEWMERDRAEVNKAHQERIERTRYIPEYNSWQKDGIPEYLEKPGENGETKMIARFRCGNEALANRFWNKDRQKMCRCCGFMEETYEHIAKECSKMERTEMEVRSLMINENEGKKWMRKVWKRRKEVLE